MAGSVMKKMAFYLGLTDDDYDDQESLYDSEQEFDDGATAEFSGNTVIRPIGNASRQDVPEYTDSEDDGPKRGGHKRDQHVTGIRPPTPLRPIAMEPATIEFLVVRPVEYADSRVVADHVMSRQPVIINLQTAERDLMRRIIDTCNGVAYAIGGRLDKVADRVFLLTPSNIKVSAADRERIKEDQHQQDV
ncbi:MAG: cell division protein SepF [Actinobacteria bacterium]|jgi:cell division inhibitor SepF|nr:cell division protein SepF [Actinomycetota bacterium]